MSDPLECWYAALRSEFGIVLSTPEPDKAKQRLYRARADSGDLELNSIAVCTSPTTPGELWLVKKR